MTVYIPSSRVAATPAAPSATGASIRVAAFSCRGLESLSRDLGFRVAVVAAVPDADRHRRRLSDLWYASGVARTHEEWYSPIDFDNWHYRDWTKLAIDPRWFGGAPHPLAGCVDDGDLLLRLPVGAAPRTFSKTFEDGLAHLRFEAVARKPANLARRHYARRPVAVGSRYALASTTGMTAVEVRDAVRFDPRTLRRVADVAVAALRSAADRVAARAPETARPTGVAP